MGKKEVDPMERPTYIIGHKNPDTDSIASAIAYEYLKSQKEDGVFVASRCGNVNSETQYVLDRFGFSAPKFIGDVRTQVRDMEIRKVRGVPEEMSLKRAWEIMKENKVVTLCITEGKLLKALITTGDIMESYMGSYEANTLSAAHTSYRNIVDTLDGEMIVGNIDDVQTEGKVMIGAGTPDAMEKLIAPHDMVILGDRYDSHFCAIEMDADCIIVCAGASVTESIRRLANEKGCKVITTPHSTFTVARLIFQSMPLRYFMKSEDLLTVKMDDYIEDVLPIMATTRHRYFPVVDSAGRYKGMVSRRNFLGASKKKVILVDHNEKSQAVNGVESAELLEIIDHHRLGTIATARPVFFWNQPVGCTCTIIYRMYWEMGVDIPKDVAGVMLSAIISDTLLYRSPTCTEADRTAGEALARIAGVDPEELAKSMFTAGSYVGDKSASEILHQDFKKFTVGDHAIAVGQISTMDSNEVSLIRDRLAPEMDSLRERDGVDLLFFMITNILQESSEVLFSGAGAEMILENGFNVTSRDRVSVHLPGVVSRKKQMLPTITGTIQI